MVTPELRESERWKSLDNRLQYIISEFDSHIWIKRKSLLVTFVGESGSGKSYSALAIAEILDPEFSIKKVCSEPEEFLELVDSVERGEVIVWDEAGVGIPSREWQTLQNRLIGYVLQVIRERNIGIFFTVPSLALIDKNVRILLNYIIHAHNVDREKQIVSATFFKKRYDFLRDVLKFEKFVIFQDGKIIDPNPVPINKPSDSLANKYEVWAKRRKKKIREDAKEMIRAYKEGNVSVGIDGRTLRRMKNIAWNFYKLCFALQREKRLSVKKIAEIMGVDYQTLRNHLNWIEKNQRLLAPKLGVGLEQATE